MLLSVIICLHRKQDRENETRMCLSSSFPPPPSSSFSSFFVRGFRYNTVFIELIRALQSARNNSVAMAKDGKEEEGQVHNGMVPYRCFSEPTWNKNRVAQMHCEFLFFNDEHHQTLYSFKSPKKKKTAL